MSTRKYFFIDMDLLFVFHLIVLPVEVFCVGAVHGDGEVAAGFVFTLTTKLKATAYGVRGGWYLGWGPGNWSTGVM